MTKRKMPTQVTSDYWIWASRRDKSYPEDTDRCGKWMVMVYTSEVDQVWTVIRDAVEQNKLGSSAKVATMKPNEHASNPDVKVICIYTYDSDDRDDLLRVLTALREIGILHRAYYKEDNETLSGNYSFNTKRAVSKYWADYGKIELRVPKRR